MLKRILVGLNGSEHSQATFELAIELATAHAASVVGLGVVDVPGLTAAEAVPLGAGTFKEQRDAAIVEAELAKIDQILAAFGQRCEAGGVACHLQKLIGDPVQVLSREAQRCDLIVVGHQHLPSQEWERASHTLGQLLRHAPRPVLCSGPARSGGAAVLIAYDASLQAARTLQAFLTSGLANDRELHLFSGGDKADEHAALAVDFLQTHQLAPQLHLDSSTAGIPQRILEVARQVGAGLIVLGSHGQPRLKEFFFGSITQEILRESTVPLFLFH